MYEKPIVKLGKPRREVEYSTDRSPYQERSKTFTWRKNYWGKLALLAMHHYLLAKTTDAAIVLAGNFSESGITPQGVYDFVKRVVPEVLIEHERLTGEPMPVSKPKKRMNMWFLDHRRKGQGCRKCLSPEHPLIWGPESERELMELALQRVKERF